MMPRHGAAESGPRAQLCADTKCIGTASRRLRAVGFVLGSVVLATLAGCCCYNEGVDSVLKHTEAKLAYSDPSDCAAPEELGHDYKLGWQAGYVEVSEGRSGRPPAVPPYRYRTYKYQSGSGKHATAAWYYGFAAGAAAAKCRGLDHANRVFSVESPCCICPGNCECPPAGVLPSAEAMLQRQAMRRQAIIHQGPVVEERIIEERIIDDRLANPPAVPTPAPEAVDQPPASGARVEPRIPTGPHLADGRSEAMPGGLVKPQIATPEAVDLPTNISQFDRDRITSPSRVALAPLPTATPEPGRVSDEPKVVITVPAPPAAATEPSKNSEPQPRDIVIGEPARSGVAVVEPQAEVSQEPQMARNQATAVSPMPTDVAPVPSTPPLPEHDLPAYRFKPFDGPPVVMATEPHVPLSLSQPNEVRPERTSAPAATKRTAPVPKVVVRKTPQAEPSKRAEREVRSIAIHPPVAPLHSLPPTLMVEQEPETTVPLRQPSALLLEHPAQRKFSQQAAPLPRAAVRETPQMEAAALPAPNEQANSVPRPQAPPQPFPPSAVAEQKTHEMVAVPDRIDFPASAQPLSSARDVDVVAPQATPGSATRPVPLVIQPLPPESEGARILLELPEFTASVPGSGEVAGDKLMQPENVRRDMREVPRSQPESQSPQPGHQQEPSRATLPRKLVEVPNELAMPGSIAGVRPPERSVRSAAASVADKRHIMSAQPLPALDSSAGEVDGVDAPVWTPSQLNFPIGIQFSLSDHQFEQTASPLKLTQPSNMQPEVTSDASNEIGFPRNVWPTAYEVQLPPVR